MAGFREIRRAKASKVSKDTVAKIPEGSEVAEPRSETVMDAGEVDGTAGTCNILRVGPVFGQYTGRFHFGTVDK